MLGFRVSKFGVQFWCHGLGLGFGAQRLGFQEHVGLAGLGHSLAESQS